MKETILDSECIEKAISYTKLSILFAVVKNAPILSCHALKNVDISPDRTLYETFFDVPNTFAKKLLFMLFLFLVRFYFCSTLKYTKFLARSTALVTFTSSNIII